MSGPVAVQWTLSHTADNFLKVGKDLIRAASDDNVQSLTLLACAQFGATLSICPDTRDKVQKLLREQNKPLFLRFMKAQVGYVKGDSVDILAKSLAGTNMLALSAALVSTCSNFEAASALEIMITQTAGDKTLVPTAHHLKDLLDILEPKLNRAGLLNDVLNWKDVWAGGQGKDSSRFIQRGDAYPCSEGISTIVSSFRELARVGDAKKIVFTTGYCVSWLTAFAKWCLGVPPNMYNEAGEAIWEQPGSQVTILYCKQDEYDKTIKIEMTREFGEITEVFYAQVVTDDTSIASARSVSGMTDIPTFGKRRIQRQDLHEGLGHRALIQAIPYALQLVLDRCVFGAELDILHDVKSMKLRPFSPFPDALSLPNVCAKYMAAERPMNLQTLEEGLLLSDLTAVSLWAKEHKSFLDPEPEIEFITRISHIVADILALSLFDECLEHLLLYCSRGYDTARPQDSTADWFDMVRNVLLTGKQERCSTTMVLAWAMNMLGHDIWDKLRRGEWVGSSFRGQVVFPAIFETLRLAPDGASRLLCVPGVLALGSKNSRRFSMVESLQPRVLWSQKPPGLDGQVSCCQNLCDNQSSQWQSSSSAHALQVGFGWTQSLTRMRPFDILRALPHAVFLETCIHGPNAKMAKNIAELRFLVPGENVSLTSSKRFESDAGVGVYPVLGNPGLRILSVCSTIYLQKDAGFSDKTVAIVNQNACLDCLLQACQLLGCRHIIM